MSRPLRQIVPGVPMHVIHRGNNRSRIFTETAEYLWFRAALRSEATHARCAMHAYILMPNHVHMLLTPSDADGPSRMMQRLGGEYARYFNDRHKRTGTLWEGRYRSTLVDTDQYFFRCSRYIEENALRAGIVSDPLEYRWSSFRTNAVGARDTLVTAHPLYEGLHSNPSSRPAAYRAMFTGCLDDRVLDEIRTAARRGTVFGAPAFRDAMQARRRDRPLLAHGGDRKSVAFARRDAADDGQSGSLRA